MKWWGKITGALKQVSDYLVTFGPAGLFAIALLDSALVPLPGGADAVMIALTLRNPQGMPLYALAGTTGSVIGCIILYYISRRAGRGALKRFPEKKRARVKELVDRFDVLSVLVASVLPPPFPFKLFVITAGVFRLSVVRFALAVAAGRAFRFFLEGYLAVRYGEHAAEILKKNYPFIGLGVAVCLVAFFLLRGRLGRGKSVRENDSPEVGEAGLRETDV
ncbi:MAG TPA: VTT domain-containing protein [Pyrinomonadaceae bacterium]|nr:VTT domain-containing protein [Pyrinomonadaceae bacterium]